MILLHPDWTLDLSSPYFQAQIVQNAAVRLLTGTKKDEQIAPVLDSILWIPVYFRIQFLLIVDGPLYCSLVSVSCLNVL